MPQALLAGKPAIAFDVDGAGEVIEHGVTGLLVKPKDIAGLKEAMAWTLANLDEARHRALIGRERCQRRFDWEEMVVRLLAIYEEGLKKIRDEKEKKNGDARSACSTIRARRA
ncbi:MAG: glycosyltransferase [Planctomycetota bacterium]|nr:glycosyltransferase [Planctomycetota bacterium]